MKIYLAGKINDCPDWRATIVDRRQFPEKTYSHCGWREEWGKGAIFGAHDYVGPYWAHHHNECGLHSTYTPFMDDLPDTTDQVRIVDNCVLAVTSADLVFVRYMSNEEPSIGAVAEVAWAFQKRIPVIGYGDLSKDSWFVQRMCNEWFDCRRGTEADALRVLLKMVNYRDYINSPQWKQFATGIKSQRGDRCQICNSSNSLDAHHRTYERLGWEDPSDITVLCRACHELYESHKRLPKIVQLVTEPLAKIESTAPVIRSEPTGIIRPRAKAPEGTA